MTDYKKGILYNYDWQYKAILNEHFWKRYENAWFSYLNPCMQSYESQKGDFLAFVNLLSVHCNTTESAGLNCII